MESKLLNALCLIQNKQCRLQDYTPQIFLYLTLRDLIDFNLWKCNKALQSKCK